MPQFTHTIYHPKDHLIFYPLGPSFMLIGQLIDEIGLLLDEILSFRSIIFKRPVGATHKKDSTRQNPKFDFFLFFPCGRRRRSRKEKAKPKKKSKKRVCLRTMPQQIYGSLDL